MRSVLVAEHAIPVATALRRFLESAGYAVIVVGTATEALREANLGLTPMNDGEIIRLPIPPLTEERRKEIAKQVKTKGEEHKVAIRNERRDANEKLKGLLKDKKITEDENKRASERVQKETDAGVAQVDQIIAKKEKEVMEV